MVDLDDSARLLKLNSGCFGISTRLKCFGSAIGSVCKAMGADLCLCLMRLLQMKFAALEMKQYRADGSTEPRFDHSNFKLNPN